MYNRPTQIIGHRSVLRVEVTEKIMAAKFVFIDEELGIQDKGLRKNIH